MKKKKYEKLLFQFLDVADVIVMSGEIEDETPEWDIFGQIL